MRDISKYVDDYEKRNPFEEFQVKYRRKRVLSSLEDNSRKGGVILEIGCGLEPLFLYTDRFSKYYIVEPAKSFFENAKKMSDHNSNIICINQFFEDCINSLINIHFDFVVCSSLLHEVEKPIELLRAIYQICDKDTVVHINVPNAKSFHRILAMEGGIIDSIYQKSVNNKRLQQNMVFDLTSLSKCCSSVGKIEIIESGSYFVKPFTHNQMQQCIDKGIINSEVLDGLYKISEHIPDMGSEIFIDFKWSK